MVQLISDPTLSHHADGTATPENGSGSWTKDAAGRQEESGNRVMSREEHAQRARDLALKRGMMRTPRRGWSMTEYQGDANTPTPPAPANVYFDRQVSIPENSALPASAFASPLPPTPLPADLPQKQTQQAVVQLPQRPKLPPPRRSYSVMDYEPPPPNLPKPSTRLTMLDLPSEIHYLFCDYLDPIDSVCFGLAHSKIYDIHRRKYGTVPLSSRYSGPNDREWAWRGAGPLVKPSNGAVPGAAAAAAVAMTASTSTELATMRTRGQVYCRKCGISRCELHRHLKDWMGEGMEYCEIKEMYGAPPGEHAKPYCYLSSPKNPNRCGRHGGKTA